MASSLKIIYTVWIWGLPPWRSYQVRYDNLTSAPWHLIIISQTYCLFYQWAFVSSSYKVLFDSVSRCIAAILLVSVIGSPGPFRDFYVRYKLKQFIPQSGCIWQNICRSNDVSFISITTDNTSFCSSLLHIQYVTIDFVRCHYINSCRCDLQLKT